jgi:hypothetical protein
VAAFILTQLNDNPVVDYIDPSRWILGYGTSTRLTFQTVSANPYQAPNGYRVLGNSGLEYGFDVPDWVSSVRITELWQGNGFGWTNTGHYAWYYDSTLPTSYSYRTYYSDPYGAYPSCGEIPATTNLYTNSYVLSWPSVPTYKTFTATIPTQSVSGTNPVEPRYLLKMTAIYR